MVDIRQLVEWLGPEGAAVGLQGSELTIADLLALAKENNVSITKRMTRNEVVSALVEPFAKRIDKSMDELLSMNREGLRAYLESVRASRKELLHLLAEVDMRPPGKLKGSLLEFVAREISDIGLYQRVAKGHGRD